jgi:hypothetical protein
MNNSFHWGNRVFGLDRMRPDYLLLPVVFRRENGVSDLGAMIQALQMERVDFPPSPSNFSMSGQLQAETDLSVGHAVTRGACDPGKWCAGRAVSLRRPRQR